MRIAIGSDHIGFPRKGALVAALEDAGHAVLDLGPFSDEPVDYPDYARAVGNAVQRGFVDAGVLVCASAAGAAMAANKVRGVRAAACADAAAACDSRRELDANTLCLPASLEVERAIAIALVWTSTPFSGDDVHARHLSKLADIEAEPRPGSDRAPRATAPPLPGAPPPAPRAGTPPAPAEAAPAPAASAPRETAAAVAHRPPAGPTAPAQAPPQAAPPPPPRPAIRDALALPVAEETLALLDSQDFVDRLWVKDASLWRGDAEAVQQRLGWLTSPAVMRAHVDELKRFADEVRRQSTSQVVLLGAGGGFAVGRTLAAMFPARMGFPDLSALDSPHPGGVKRVLESVPPGRALFVVADKSGADAQTLAAYAFFRQRVDATGKPGLQFVAITDPGTPLERLAADAGFRRTFLNSPSIGSSYAGLCFFGLVPAALVGVDVKAVLERAQAMVEQCGGSSGARDNPGVRLGAALAGLARAGRDKVTLLCSEPIRPLGAWIGHLLAASLGQAERGVVPVVGEAPGDPDVYEQDRVFVELALEGDQQFDSLLHALDRAGHPVIRIALRDRLDVGAELFRWQVAAATAGAVLGVDPFAEPDATAQQRAASVLAAWRARRRFPQWPVAAEEEGVAVLSPEPTTAGSVSEALAAHLAQAGPGDCVALLACMPRRDEHENRLQALRALVRDQLRVATTLAFGPAGLDGMGPLPRGGANGVFIQIVAPDEEDLAIPGADHGFSALAGARAWADLEALRERGRPVIRVRLAGAPSQGLDRLLQLARQAIRRL